MNDLEERLVEMSKQLPVETSLSDALSPPKAGKIQIHKKLHGELFYDVIRHILVNLSKSTLEDSVKWIDSWGNLLDLDERSCELLKRHQPPKIMIDTDFILKDKK
jgi:hypothetical protein